MQWLTSRITALISGGIILLIGQAGWMMDGQREAIYRAMAAAYLVMATYWVIDVTPIWLSVGAIGGLRDRIGKTWTWPLPNSITAVQALPLSTAPALINVIKNYLAPLIKLISGSA